MKNTTTITLELKDSGSGTPIVFVHGTAAAAHRWKQVSRLFSPTHRVIEYERRGRGASEDAESYSLDDEISDLISVINRVDTGEPLDVVAHSFGGLISLAALCESPSYFKRLIIYEAPVSIPGQCNFIDMKRVDRLESILDNEGKEQATEFFLREFPRVPEQEISELKKLASWPERVAAAHTIVRELRAASEYVPDKKKLEKCTVPCLLLVGGDSYEAFSQSAKALSESLPDAEITILPGEKHRAMDTVPELVYDIIRQFLEK